MTSNIEMSRRMDILFHFGSTFFFSILNDNESMKFARSNNTRFYSSTDVLVAIGHNSQLTLTSHCSARISHISFTVTSRHFFSFLFSLLFFLLSFFSFFFLCDRSHTLSDGISAAELTRRIGRADGRSNLN